MLFCLGDSKFESEGNGYQKSFRVFNQQLTESEFKEIKNSLPDIALSLTCWIDKKDMGKDEKNSVSGWSEMGGYLKILDYEEAWAKWWNKAKQSDKNKILNCKYFDAVIFKGITGIDVSQVKKQSLKGKTVKVELDGESYEAIIQ